MAREVHLLPFQMLWNFPLFWETSFGGGQFQQWRWIFFSLTSADVLSIKSQLLFCCKDCGSSEINQPWNRECVSLYLPGELHQCMMCWRSRLSCYFMPFVFRKSDCCITLIYILHSVFRFNHLKSQSRQTLFFVKAKFCRGQVQESGCT